MIELIREIDEERLEMVRSLFIEYAESLNFDLCFQDFDKEVAGLPGDYAEPEGRILIAEYNGRTAGCVALRRIDNETCEMKRLYVRPEFRGKKLGRELADRIIKEAKEIGYKRMKLDTTPQMKEAIELYKSLGFGEAKPYRYNPIEGAMYMEKSLKVKKTKVKSRRRPKD